MDFMNCVKEEASKCLTENGAVGYSTTGKALVDFNFKLPSYRKNRTSIVEDLMGIVEEKDPYLFKYLFYLRDCREGLGERDTFRLGLLTALRNTKMSVDEIYSILQSIPEVGRWDDLLVFADSEFEEFAFSLIKAQFFADIEDSRFDRPISLLAKWLPSDNASSKASRYLAHKLANFFGCCVRDYRREVVRLRKYLDVTEVKACANNWNEIDYNKVSSNANLRYKDAFMRHDEERRRAYLDALAKGDKGVVMHSATNFPHDIVKSYFGPGAEMWYSSDTLLNYDEAIEQLWKNLPDMPGLDDTLVIRDGSGSMTSHIPGSSVRALDVADALSLYCAARCKGCFKDTFITFSSKPQVVSVSDKVSLHDKLEKLRKFNDCSNTDLEATFMLILRTAVANNMKQEDLPKQLLIISDMEFDASHTYAYGTFDTTPLMKHVAKLFAEAGYTIPKLVFWNVNSRTNTIPMKENDAGVVLVSGFSVNTIKMVLSGKLSPYECIIDALSAEKYNEIPFARY